MSKSFRVIAACVLMIFLYSCSKKTQPAAPPHSPNVTIVRTPDSAGTVVTPAKKKMVPVKAKPLPSVPKVIVVNDASAKKAVDGRLYYDLQGHRYWRSNKDGKYYLFNKSMQNDPDFKASKKS